MVDLTEHDANMPEVWEDIQRERNALEQSRSGEKRTTQEWIDAVAQRVNAMRLASGKGIWPIALIWRTWLIMSLQAANHWEAVATELAVRAKSSVSS